MKPVGVRLGDGWQSHVPTEWVRDWKPRTVPLSDGTIDVIDVGSGPVLVLVPPLPGYKEAFLACVPLLAQSFRVITFDLRASLPREAAWSALVRDAEQIADALNLGRAAVVGHSLGGALAQHWALAHPDRVRALVLSSAFRHVASPPGHWYMRYVEQPVVVAGQRFLPRSMAMATARALARDGAWVYDAACDDAVLEIVRLGIRRCPIRLGLQRVRLAYAHDTRASIARLRCPVLLLVGEKDTEFARAETFAIGRELGVDVIEFPRVGHLHPLSNADTFAHAVTGWMRLLPGA